MIHTLTIIVIISGILFSSISYLDRISSLPPDEGLLDSFFWLSGNRQGEILAHESKSFWIHYATNQPAFIDPLSASFANDLEISDKIFQSTDITEALDLLKAHNISSIWIDPLMVNGQVWQEPRQGLLSLLSNEKFKKVYDKQGVRVWSVES